jgi:hypothetical protein
MKKGANDTEGSSDISPPWFRPCRAPGSLIRARNVNERLCYRLRQITMALMIYKLGVEAAMARYFPEDSTLATRALQAYLILIGRASNQQTIQYRQLCEIMHWGTGGPILAGPLGRLMHWCAREGLPALTSIVVEKETGIPSTGLTTVEENDFPAEQQRVFAFDWYSIFPPTPRELGQ